MHTPTDKQQSPILRDILRELEKQYPGKVRFIPGWLCVMIVAAVLLFFIAVARGVILLGV